MTITQDPSDGIIRIYFDASALKDSSCFRKIYWTVVKGYKTEKKIINYPIAYGNACHKFAERHYCGVDLAENLELTRKYYEPYHDSIQYSEETEFRTLKHLNNVCKKYAQTFPTEHDCIQVVRINEVPLVEQQFAFPVWKSEDGKIEVILCGTIDMVADYQGTRVFIDHKTTTSWYKEGYFKQYQMNVQMQLYSWALKKILGTSYYLSCVVNGWFIKKPTDKSEKMGVFDGVKFERSNIIDYSEEQMAQFEGWLSYKLGSILAFFKENKLEEMSKHLDYTACNNYGLCKFFDVCRLKPSVQEDVLNSKFTTIPYEPLKFRE